tara:strand:- start:711 stop:908 length:198 start_codon:yes stop_codon:yes gene_type:complete
MFQHFALFAFAKDFAGFGVLRVVPEDQAAITAPATTALGANARGAEASVFLTIRRTNEASVSFHG